MSKIMWLRSAEPDYAGKEVSRELKDRMMHGWRARRHSLHYDTPRTFGLLKGSSVLMRRSLIRDLGSEFSAVKL